MDFHLRGDIVVNVILIALSSPQHYSCWNLLSVETLAGDIKGYFHSKIQVKILLCPNDADPRTVAETCLAERPQIIGFSVHPGTAALCREILAQLKAGLPADGKHPLVVFGNKLPTYSPQQFLDAWPGALIACGEAEHTLRGLVEHVTEQRPLSIVPNLIATTTKSFPRNGSCRIYARSSIRRRWIRSIVRCRVEAMPSCKRAGGVPGRNAISV
jgi:radical SAM superfamily enzyme YgiQ (UPF0313 family)